MLPSIIHKIYVINLERCGERRTHIEEEFSHLNIENYEFFKAVDKNDQQVVDLMKTNFVKKFPPCFRCGKNRCNCCTNELIPSQIGNWLSYKNVMSHIVNNHSEGLIMLCEDDIKFTNQGLGILQYVFSPDVFQENNIDFNKPILIRIGCGYNPKWHDVVKIPSFIKYRLMSNPAFIINAHFAKLFLENLSKINTTSDIYIHTILPNNKDVQDFTVYPVPIYELSWHPQKAIFSSEIGIRNWVKHKEEIRKV